MWYNPFSAHKYGVEESLRLYEERVLYSPILQDNLHTLENKVLVCTRQHNTTQRCTAEILCDVVRIRRMLREDKTALDPYLWRRLPRDVVYYILERVKTCMYYRAMLVSKRGRSCILGSGNLCLWVLRNMHLYATRNEKRVAEYGVQHGVHPLGVPYNVYKYCFLFTEPWRAHESILECKAIYIHEMIVTYGTQLYTTNKSLVHRLFSTLIALYGARQVLLRAFGRSPGPGVYCFSTPGRRLAEIIGPLVAEQGYARIVTTQRREEWLLCIRRGEELCPISYTLYMRQDLGEHLELISEEIAELHPTLEQLDALE